MTDNDGRLGGRVAIVTGAGSGFGEGIARRFAQEGAAVVVNDINEDGGHLVVQGITTDGGRADFFKADVSVGDQVKALVAHARDAFGRLDIMVNNAGVSHVNQPMTDVTEDEFDKIFAVNVKSIYHAAKHAVPVFRALGGGVFVNIASTAAVRPRPGLAWYNASKGAVVTVTKSMALELAPDKIRVNAVNPVAGDTPLLATFMGEDTPEKRAAFVATVPLGRLSTPADVADAALFLASDEARFITGVCLEVDGGRCV